MFVLLLECGGNSQGFRASTFLYYTFRRYVKTAVHLGGGSGTNCMTQGGVGGCL